MDEKPKLQDFTLASIKKKQMLLAGYLENQNLHLQSWIQCDSDLVAFLEKHLRELESANCALRSARESSIKQRLQSVKKESKNVAEVAE